MSRSFFIGTALVMAVAGGILALWPELDLAASRLFWTEGEGFWLAGQGWAGTIRFVSMWPTIGIGLAAIVSLVQHIVAPASRQFMAARTALFLSLTVLLGPVLLVNGLFKEHWDRARPVHVSEFGGAWRFTPWWRPGDGTECRTNCSFISGEASGAAWLVAPALLAPPPVRPAALAAAGVYIAAISVMRIAFGGHFLSDTLLAICATLAIILWTYRWLVRPPDAPSEIVVDERLARLGRPLRRVFGARS